EFISDDSNQVALFMSVVIFGGALLQWPIGHLSDWIDRRKVLLVTCLLAAGFALAAYPAIMLSPYLLYLAMFLFGGTAFTIYAIGVAHVNDQLESTEMLEATRGLLLVYGLGAALGPMLAAQFMKSYGNIHLLGFFSASLAILSLYGVYRLLVGQAPDVAAKGEFVPLVRTSTVVLEMAPQLVDAPDDASRMPEAKA
ncbi:MAG: MFS transporter, partial [Gammaproteobacteria bacterium]|nr:MFS transporter [Gammaproteobacteria bacterium]